MQRSRSALGSQKADDSVVIKRPRLPLSGKISRFFREPCGQNDILYELSMDQSRTIALLGEETVQRLGEIRVILLGVGGVGGWCAEALVRSGVCHLTLVDSDEVAPSNINRQLVATADNIGQSKVEEMRRRLLSINPEADITALHRRYPAEGEEGADDPIWQWNQYDYVVDAIDSLDCKMHLIYTASHSRATLVSSMGAARRVDTERIHVAEFHKVHGCPLARALRTRMKKADRLPARPFLCVYSDEPPVSESGTIAPVVGVFGMTLANVVIKDRLRLKEQRPLR